jgi:hypothetical protein
MGVPPLVPAFSTKTRRRLLVAVLGGQDVELCSAATTPDAPDGAALHEWRAALHELRQQI